MGDSSWEGAKVLGTGSVSVACNVVANKFSETASNHHLYFRKPNDKKFIILLITH
ncbi:uL15m family ribosomal protein [Vreelandella sp. V005]|uniref:uL15m family ribosomal protein n=1 Tax=Vreelandella sp. V005 TaxID=3459608 RepID=UPI004043FBD1